MPKQLLSKKSVFMTRRKIIIYIVMTILILGIVAGFTNTFSSDNRIITAGYNEIIVMEAEPPKSGTPEDYDLLSNLKFTAYKLHHSTYFRGYTKGKAVADVGGVGSYTQYLTNNRVVYNEKTVFTETISSSSLKKLADQIYAEDDIVIYRPSTKVTDGGATFSNKAYQMSYDDYSKKYGSIPNQLSKYKINEKTILSVKDENAKTAAPLNASPDSDESDDEISFTVPDRLYPNADGNYVFSLTLDPQTSSEYYRNEVRTRGGADSNPLFHSVRVVITINSEWIPLSVRTYENYDIEIPVLGAMNCSGDNLEVFSMINEVGEVPEKDFFQPYIDAAKSNPDYEPPTVDVSGPPSASDYLATAFADYLSGEKNLDLNADISIGDNFSAYDLDLSINLNTLDIQAQLSDGLYVKYSDGKVYLKNNDINGYISVENAKKLASDPVIAELIGGMSKLDLNKIFGGDMLDVIFAGCEMTTENDITKIPMSFDLDLTSVVPSLKNVHVDASILINDKDKSLRTITGDVTLNGTKIHIDVAPLKKAPSFPSVEKAVSLDDIIDFVPDILATAKQKTYGIDGTLSLNGTDVGVSAYIDREGDLTAEATLNVMGLDVVVKYVDETIYAEALGLTVRGTTEELPDLITALLDLLGMNKYQNLLKGMLPKSVNEVADMLKTLTVTDDTLNIGLKALTIIPVDIKLTRANGRLKNLGLDVNVDLFGIKADIGADIEISEPAKRAVTAPVASEYITFADLARIITDAKPYLQSDYFTVTLNGYAEIDGAKQTLGGYFNIDKLTDRNGEVTGVSANGVLNLLGQEVGIVYVGDVAYISLGNVKVKLDTANTDELIGSVKDLITLVTGKDEILPDIEIADLLDGAIKQVSINGNVITLSLAVSGCDINAVIDLKSGKIGIVVNANNINAKLDLTIKTAKYNRNITAPNDAADYVEITELTPTVKKLTDIIAASGVKTTIVLSVGETRVSADLAVGYDNGTLKARLTAEELALDVAVIGDTAYVTLGGVKVSGTLADITRLIDEVKVNLPAEAINYISDLITSVTESVTSSLPTEIDIDVAEALDNALASIQSLALNDGVLTLKIGVNGITATLAVSSDAKEITATVIYGGNSYGLSLTDITAITVDHAIAAQEYVPASDLITAIECVLPFIKENAFDITVSGSVYGQTVTGDIYVDLADYTLDNLAAKLHFTVSDVVVDITAIDKTLYLDVNNGSIRIAQELTVSAITELIAQLDNALPELGIADMISSLTDINITLPEKIELSDIAKYLNTVSLSPTEDGMALNVAVNDSTVSICVSLADGALSGVAVNCDISGKTANIELAVETENGVLTGIQTTKANILGTEFGFAATVTPAASKALTAPSISDYVTVADFIPYIAPALDLMERAMGSDVITLDINRMTLEVMQKQMDIRGRISLMLEPALTVRADIVLFADTTDEIELTVIYADGVLYIKTGETVDTDGNETGGIKLKFDVGNDVDALFAALEKYLPESIKSLSDFGSMSAISAVISGIKQLMTATSIEQAVNILFGMDNAFNTSVVKQAFDTVSLIKSNGNIALRLTAMNIPVNIIPELDGDELGVVINTQMANNAIGLSLKLTLGEPVGSQHIAAPADSEYYVSVITFVTKVIDAANTLTAKPEDVTTVEDGVTTTVSQTAFEVDSFTFDYDIFKVKTEIDEQTGKEIQVTDPETGRVVIEEDAKGAKVIDKTIQVTTPNITSDDDALKALRFAIVKTTVTDQAGAKTTKTSIIAEAHLIIDIKLNGAASQLGFPIALDLYVRPTEEYPDGLAYLYYRESVDAQATYASATEYMSKLDKYGEKIAIDYNSIMQIVAAAMDIVGAHDAAEQLLGDYRLPVDTEVFDSMSINGFNDISKMLNGLADAITEVKAALSDVKNAWKNFQATKTIDELIAEIANDKISVESENADEPQDRPTVKAYIASAISHAKAAIELFASDDGEDKDSTDDAPESNKMNGALAGKILRGISFTDVNNVLSALVDNEMATGTKGTATVSVTSKDDKINNIAVKNLDVNTAKLKTFDLTFAPTQNITVTIPDSYTTENTDGNKVRYANLGNIKHLLFDVMNTANMMEFEIGGLDTNDSIKVDLKLGADWLANFKLTVKYDAKVKIIKTGEDENGKAIYKTAAAVEIRNEKAQVKILGIGSTVIVPDCTTMLYFYDDVIYIQGVKDWGNNAVVPIGFNNTTTSTRTRTREWNIWKWGDWSDWSSPDVTTVNSNLTVKSSDEYGFEYVNVMYTVDELFYMIKNNIGKFLDEFLFYLIPITKEKVAGQDIRQLINDNIGNSGSDNVNNQNTLAQIFKLYNYDGSAHKIVIGLAELAGSSSLSDLTLTLVGKNDKDDDQGKILNNYISSLSVKTSIAGIIDVSLDATLNNVSENKNNDTIKSRGLTHITSNYYNSNFTFNNNNYVMINSYLPDTVLTIDGSLIYTDMDDAALFASLPNVIPVVGYDSFDKQDAKHRTESTNTDTSGSLGSKETETTTTTKQWLTAGYLKTGGNTDYYIGVNADGSKYVYKLDSNGNRVRIAEKSLINTLLAEVTHDKDGKVTSVTNRAGGIQWSRPWKEAYDAAKAAESAA